MTIVRVNDITCYVNSLDDKQLIFSLGLDQSKNIITRLVNAQQSHVLIKRAHYGMSSESSMLKNVAACVKETFNINAVCAAH